MADPFDELAHRAGPVVGKQEEILREHLGTDRYDKVLAMSDEQALASTNYMRSRAMYFELIGRAASILTLSAFLLVVGWIVLTACGK